MNAQDEPGMWVPARLLETAIAVTADTREASDRARDYVQERYGVRLEPHEPRVFWRPTDNWLDLTVRFVVPEHGIREIEGRIHATSAYCLRWRGY